MKQTDGLRGNADFRKLWLARGVSALGSQISSVAITFTAILLLHATPTELGWLAAVGSLPFIFFSLFAGVWADRVSRRPLLIAADLGRAVLLGSIPLAALFGALTLWQLLVVALLVGVLSILFNVSDQAYLPSVVRRDQLVDANGRLGVVDAVAEVGGPGLGGVLVSVLSAPIAVVFDALSFIFSAASLALIRTPEAKPVPHEDGSSIWREVREGMGVVFSNPYVRAITLSMATASLFGNMIGTLYSYYAITDLGLDPAAVGITISVGGATALLGALLVGPLARRYPLGRLMIGCMVVHHLIQLLIPLAGGPPLVAFGMLVVSQLGDVFGTIYTINELSLRQSVVADHLLGRVNASVGFLVGGVVPVSALLAGGLGAWLGARTVMWIAVLGLAASTLWLIFSPIRNLAAINEQPELNASPR